MICAGLPLLFKTLARFAVLLMKPAVFASIVPVTPASPAPEDKSPNQFLSSIALKALTDCCKALVTFPTESSDGTADETALTISLAKDAESTAPAI